MFIDKCSCPRRGEYGGRNRCMHRVQPCRCSRFVTPVLHWFSTVSLAASGTVSYFLFTLLGAPARSPPWALLVRRRVLTRPRASRRDDDRSVGVKTLAGGAAETEVRRVQTAGAPCLGSRVSSSPLNWIDFLLLVTCLKRSQMKEQGMEWGLDKPQGSSS